MNHEKLICYQKLVRAAKELSKIQKSFPSGKSYLTDQLNRAISSCILNLAEGNSRRSTKERKRFFDISLASIAEVLACVDILEAFHLISPYSYQEIKSELKTSYKMVFNL